MATTEEAKEFEERHAWHLRTQTPIEPLTTTADENECRFRIWAVKHTIGAPTLGLSITEDEIRAILQSHGWDYIDAAMSLLLR